MDAAISFNEVVACDGIATPWWHLAVEMVVRSTSTPNGQGGSGLPIAAIAQIVSGMRALVWTELATDHSKHARLTLRPIRNDRLDRVRFAPTVLESRTSDFESSAAFVTAELQPLSPT
ncbi:MAG: hypothetical protein Udaeo2_02210 [Candidatus Udaeobacter sp.]|nr:MAG: hypothetical protein Udaeo2_02210 [Candidatus Udaeobacter sp.]